MTEPTPEQLAKLEELNAALAADTARLATAVDGAIDLFLLPFLRNLEVGVNAAFEAENRPDDVHAYRTGDTISVTVSRMFSFIPLTFACLMRLSDLFGTQEFTVSQDSDKGSCPHDTCDYGSSYSHTFTFTRKEGQ